jgi:hypothetical protein
LPETSEKIELGINSAAIRPYDAKQIQQKAGSSDGWSPALFFSQAAFLGLQKAEYLNWIKRAGSRFFPSCVLNCHFPTFCRSNSYALFDA